MTPQEIKSNLISSLDQQIGADELSIMLLAKSRNAETRNLISESLNELKERKLAERTLLRSQLTTVQA